MILRIALVSALLLPVAKSGAQEPGRVSWDGTTVPITIEVARDVPVMATEGYRQQRGTLYSSAEFVIRKGERFRMVEQGREGSCRIEYRQARFALSSCPWMPGFTDHQADIFVVVQVGGGAD